MYQYLDLEDTIIALATAPGAAAIAMLRLSGKEAFAIANAVFSKKNLQDEPGHTAHLGYVRNEEGGLIDQVLLTIFRGPRSYTGEDVVEFSCHGSPFIQQQLLELLLRSGARLAKQGEFTLRAFLHGRMDLAQAEAVADLIAAESASSHQLALQQMRGGFSQDIERLREQLIEFASLIELELDFGEEDVEFANREDLRSLVQAILLRLRQLSDSFQLGNVLKKGVATVIAGRPNAGKSTLLNALLREERAIVSPIAGTTRDTIEELFTIEGLQFRLIDTAGLRQAKDGIERIGIERSMQKIQEAQLLLYVFDAKEQSLAECQSDLEALPGKGLKTLLIANKLDLLSEQDQKELTKGLGKQGLLLSAKEQGGIEELKEQLYQSVIGGELQLEDGLVSNARHYEALRSAQDSLQSVLEGLDWGQTGDFLAMDIRHALRALGEITGKVDVEDLLDSIFSNFCIGK